MTNLDFLPSSWQQTIGQEFEKEYMKALSKFLKAEANHKKTIFPKGKDIFNAFKFVPYDQVKVVIIGQDPYHGDNQAHGLCFSVLKGIKPPPSLINIFKELNNELQIPIPTSGDLTKWAEQGVLLLNNVLTVERGKPFSHKDKGWEKFTDEVVKALNKREDPIIFLLWGAAAQKKGEAIDTKKHFVLKAAHPSPFSVHRGFFGCGHFKKTNEILKSLGKKEIDWSIS